MWGGTDSPRAGTTGVCVARVLDDSVFGFQGLRELLKVPMDKELNGFVSEFLGCASVHCHKTSSCEVLQG